PSRSAGRQIRVVLHALFEFAVWQEIAESNPCKFVSAGGFEPRERVLSDDELRSVWLALAAPDVIDGLFISRQIALALQLCAVTLQRRAEVAEARLDEFDLTRGEWTIPAERTKNRRTHLVPLSDLALEIVTEAKAAAGDSRHLFPSPRVNSDDDKPVTPAALSHAFRRLAAKIKLKDARPHDLRRTGATGLARVGVRRFDVSAALNHTSDTGGAARVTGTYDRYDYAVEKRAALELWAKHLRKVVA
ncbi:MAG: site-specific integrase, partial [Planctomycetales bacterium]|nr:site-specific integrase [Planctomycetales bacterium]